jgi:EMC6
MIGDPMADMGPGAGAEQLQQPNDNASGGKEVVDPLVLQLNLQRIDHIHSVMGVASGCVAGILGMTGLQGFGECYSRVKCAASLGYAPCSIGRLGSQTGDSRNRPSLTRRIHSVFTLQCVSSCCIRW